MASLRMMTRRSGRDRDGDARLGWSLQRAISVRQQDTKLAVGGDSREEPTARPQPQAKAHATSLPSSALPPGNASVNQGSPRAKIGSMGRRARGMLATALGMGTAGFDGDSIVGGAGDSEQRQWGAPVSGSNGTGGGTTAVAAPTEASASSERSRDTSSPTATVTIPSVPIVRCVLAPLRARETAHIDDLFTCTE